LWADHVISRDVQGGKGRCVIRHGDDLAELTGSFTLPVLFIADRTRVSDTLHGTGAGLGLLSCLVAEGFRIGPPCPFVDAMRRRRPDRADAFPA
jgi:predicted GNAT family acetyltransferase